MRSSRPLPLSDMPLGLSALIWALVLCYSAAFGTEALENGHLGVKCRQKILQLVGTMGQKMTVLFTFEEECKTDCTNMLYKDGTKIAEKDQNPHDPRLSYEWQKNITMTIDVLQLNDTAIYYSVIYSPGSSKILRESNCVNLTVVTEDISQENQTDTHVGTLSPENQDTKTMLFIIFMIVIVILLLVLGFTLFLIWDRNKGISSPHILSSKQQENNVHHSTPVYAIEYGELDFQKCPATEANQEDHVEYATIRFPDEAGAQGHQDSKVQNHIHQH